MKKVVFILGGLLLAACSAGNANQAQKQTTEESENSMSSQVLGQGGAMDTSRIKAVQDGLSDAQWNQSRGTVSDGQDTNANQVPFRILTEGAKSLIVYFSRSGSTELLASKIQARTGADVLEIVVANPYSANYGETVQRANGERQVEEDPQLVLDVPDLSQYDTVYLGYPIWGMTLAEPMASFVENYASQLAGKRLVPFSTNGSYGIGSSVDRISRILSERQVTATITTPYTIQGNRVSQADESLDAWLDSLN